MLAHKTRLVRIVDVSLAGSTTVTEKATLSAITCALFSFALVGIVSAEPDTAEIVVFDAELRDTSAEGEIYGENPAETARLVLITDQLRAGLDQSEKYVVLDLAPAQDRLAELRRTVAYLHDCNNCELEIAEALEAEQSVIVWVQKVSNLILNLNVVIKDVNTGSIIKTAFVDIRGNTDKSWQHGTRYMLKNRLLVEPGVEQE